MKAVNILGIETSCDETAAAVVQDGTMLLSNVIVSQIDIHAEFGGVVPEVAARSHIEVMLPVVEKALHEAFSTGDRSQKTGVRSNEELKTQAADHGLQSAQSDLWGQIDGIAVTYGPGLLGSLLIGTLTARTLALLKNKPLYPVNHVEGHTYANFITEISVNSKVKSSKFKQIANSKSQIQNYQLPTEQPTFPVLSLTVSGGHTQLILFENHRSYGLLGQTQDDAVGEAFDKVAKVLGLSYPGGPSVAKAAEAGNPHAYNLPKAAVGEFDFSFSGLKTAVLRHVQRLVGKDYSFPSYEIAPLLSKQQINDTAASFQRVAVETLVDKTVKAYEQFQPASVVIAGGVAANQELRRQLKEALPAEIDYASPILCTDNAAMIAARGYWAASGHGETADPLKLEINPSLVM